MIAGYRIFLKLPDKVMNYHGIVIGDGVTSESRIDDELSGRKRINARFAAALEEHGRYAFDWETTGYFDSEYEAIMDEGKRIERDKSWHPDYGFNVERLDKKRLAKAEAAYVAGASIEDLLDAAFTEWKNNNVAEWSKWASPENEQLLRDIAEKEKCSIDAAFRIALEAGRLTAPTPVIDSGTF